MVIKLTETDIRNIVKTVLTETMTRLPKALFHKANPLYRKSIATKGLIPQIGDSYKCHWEGTEDKNNLIPLVFLYDIKKDEEYDSTYDDDIWAVDTSQLDIAHIGKDPDPWMKSLTYDKPIPPSALKLIYKGRKYRDSDDAPDHSDIYKNYL